MHLSSLAAWGITYATSYSRVTAMSDEFTQTRWWGSKFEDLQTAFFLTKTDEFSEEFQKIFSMGDRMELPEIPEMTGGGRSR